MKKIIFGLILMLLLIPTKAFALNEVNIYFFYGEGCNYCSQEKAYLEALKERYFNIRIYSYDIASDINNDLMKKAKELYNIDQGGIPFTIIGDSTFLGFSQSKKCDMEKKIYEYSYNKYNNKFGTSLVNVGYRTDLTGDVKEHYEESDYVIEEKGEVSTNITKKEEPSIWEDSKFKASMILVGVGLFLVLVVLIMGLLERKRRI